CAYSAGVRCPWPDHVFGGGMMKKPRLGIVAALGLVAVAVGLTVAAATASGKSSMKAPIVIGAAVDLTSSMKPFDSPALAGAQIEGSAEAEYAYSRGWRTAIVVKDNYLVYFRNVSDAFAKRFQELGGKIVDRESFTSFDKTIGNVISKVAPKKADVISFVTAF